MLSRVEQFLKDHQLSADTINEKELLSLFMEEMDRGLSGSASSLEMIPTYVGASSLPSAGKSVIVLDAGGTNFRTCLVTFDENNRAVISDFRKTSMPGLKREVSKAEFFSLLADEVERLIDKSDSIGFCFSYAARITENHDGVPLMFSKEIKAPEVIGIPVGEALLKELEKRGHDVSKKRVSVVNDTVATLLAAMAEYGSNASSYVGFILGTGTNTAYIEDESNITKLGSRRSGKQIINVESGSLRIIGGDLDRAFMETTKNPNSYYLEKKIGGAYLGPFAAFVIERAIEEGVLSASFATRFRAIACLNTTRMSNYLENPNDDDFDLVRCVNKNSEDSKALYLLLDAIIERAARLTAINLTAAVLKSNAGFDPLRPVIINADGTTFYKTENLRFYTELYLDRLLRKSYKRYYKLVYVENSPTLGAAIAGLI